MINDEYSIHTCIKKKYYDSRATSTKRANGVSKKKRPRRIKRRGTARPSATTTAGKRDGEKTIVSFNEERGPDRWGEGEKTMIVDTSRRRSWRRYVVQGVVKVFPHLPEKNCGGRRRLFDAPHAAPLFSARSSRECNGSSHPFSRRVRPSTSRRSRSIPTVGKRQGRKHIFEISQRAGSFSSLTRSFSLDLRFN